MASTVHIIEDQNTVHAVDTQNAVLLTQPIQTVSVVVGGARGIAGSAANALDFSNSNGVTFGKSGLCVTASVKTDYLTTAALSNHSHSQFLTTAAQSDHTHTLANYLTTAALSNHSHSQYLTTAAQSDHTHTLANYLTTAALSNHAHSQYLTTAAVSNHAHSQFLTTAAQSVHTHSQYLTTAAISDHSHTYTQYLTTAAQSSHTHAQYLTTAALSSHAHTQYLTTAALSTHTHTQFLTTAALSGHSHGNPSLALTNVSGTTASNSAGLTISLSANPATVFSNSNNISFGLSGSTITASASIVGQTVQTQNSVQVLGSSGNISLVNSNGITFGGSGSSITASHNGLTTAAQSAHSHGNPSLQLTNLSGSTASASDGLTFSLSGHGIQGFSASNSSVSGNTVTFGNSNGLSFYITNGSIVGSYTDAGAGAGISAVRISAGTTDRDVSNFSFANGNGVSFGISGSTITASAAAGGAGAADTYFSTLNGYASATKRLCLATQSTNSIEMYPFYLSNDLHLNVLELPMYMFINANTNTASSYSLSMSVLAGLYYRDGDANDLSLSSTALFSIAAHMTGPAASYTYISSANSTSLETAVELFTNASEQRSYVGEYLGRQALFHFGQMSLTRGQYWLGALGLAASSALSYGFYLYMLGHTNANLSLMGAFGLHNTESSGQLQHPSSQVGLGIVSQTDTAELPGFGGTNLPSALPLELINRNHNFYPMFTFRSLTN